MDIKHSDDLVLVFFGERVKFMFTSAKQKTSIVIWLYNSVTILNIAKLYA